MIRQADAVIRLHYGIDPDSLEDDAWCKLYADFLYVNKLNHLNMKVAILAAIADIFPNGNNDDTVDS